MINQIRNSVFQMRRHGTQFSVYAGLFVFFLLFFTALPSIAQASTVRKTDVHKIEFNGAAQDPLRTLDWRSPEAVLTFDVPDNDWVDDVELLLSARPLSPVSPTAPLLVRFNDAAPIPVETGGNGFDARIRLDKMRVRKERNQISFEYQVPAGQSCLTPGHGAWDIDAKSSVVVVKSRSQSRPLSFHDVRTRLSAPATAPRSVALLAKGPEALKLKALAAQGIARNTETVPNFRVKRGTADLEIIAATRSELRGWVKDNDVLGGKGPSIALGATSPLQIVLTGDNDAEVMEAAKAFSGFAIPVSYARDVSPTRFISTAPTFNQVKRISGKTKLSELGGLPFTHDWAPRPQQTVFDVADPAASFGKISLQLRTGPFVDPASTLTATLNGHTLGKVQIDRNKMNAEFDIPRGVLHGLGNRLTLKPDLKPLAEQSVCTATRIGPGFSIGPKSHIRIRSDFESDLTDLSRFSASGLPFADQNGADTHVILATQNAAENQAAFKLLAQLGRASKNGWSRAVFHSGAQAVWPETGNILLIGSQVDLDAAILSGAPKGLKIAMGGTHKQAPVTTRSAANNTELPRLLASRDIVEGGVAALYRDISGPDRIIGVITRTRGKSFIRAVDDLLDGGHWNQLEGSVFRWNRNETVMAQTAMPAQVTTSFAFTPPKMPAFKRPDLKLPDMTPFFSGIGAKWAGFTGWVSGLFAPAPDLPLPADLPVKQKPGSAAIPLRSANPQTPTFTPASEPAPITDSQQPRWKPKMPGLPEIFKRDSKPVRTLDTEPRQAPRAIPPRRDISPALPDSRLGEIGQSMGQAYTSASAQVTDAMSHSRLAQYRQSAKYESKYLLFAIFGICLLLGAVFISPSAAKRQDQE